MNIELNTFKSLGDKFNAFKVINRKEYLFKKYVIASNRKGSVLDPEIVIKELDKMIEKLVLLKPQHIILLNEKPEYNEMCEILANLTGFKLKTYSTGMFSNVALSNFTNAAAIITIHDRRDLNAIKEAKLLNLKIFGITNFSRGIKYIDYYVPVNNFSKEAIVFYFWYILKGLKDKTNSNVIDLDELFTLMGIENNGHIKET
jgi:hypothetical protein